ncbi:MAG: hypothetical protein EBR82_64580 [Caulobacteraceae bacterium]|nr:hypothetical protein [Caulobacteraceae bacterium]
MKSLLKFLLLIALIANLGCQSTIAPGADPVIVTTQQVLEVSLGTVDKFLKFEYANRSKVSPGVSEAAEQLRKEFPPAFRLARGLLTTYKQSRTPENKKLLDDYVLMVKRMAVKAQEAK